MDHDQRYERYQRQILLKEFGVAGQEKLLQAKVLVVGAGGLGCPALQYLTAAGLGQIGIVDDDVVSIDNLHRQILYTVADIGLSKAERTAAHLRRLNPDIQINIHSLRLTNKNALDIINKYDVIIDGTDNFSSRFMINDACVLLDKPLVYGAVSKFEGQVAVFNYTKNSAIKALNYRDLFPVPPAENEVKNCATAGVLGVLTGIIGTMQANETIKLITGIGEPLVNKLLTYNTLTNQFYELSLTASDEKISLMPKDKDAFIRFDYNTACAANNSFEIDIDQFYTFLENIENITIIDVREPGEKPVAAFEHLNIPLNKLKENLPYIARNTIVTFCNSGARSLQAATLLANTFASSKEIYSLKGGITNWKRRMPKELKQ